MTIIGQMHHGWICISIQLVTLIMVYADPQSTALYIGRSVAGGRGVSDNCPKLCDVIYDTTLNRDTWPADCEVETYTLIGPYWASHLIKNTSLKILNSSRHVPLRHTSSLMYSGFRC